MGNQAIDPEKMKTFKSAFQAFAFASLEQDVRLSVFDRALSLTTNLADAKDLWGETDLDSHEEERAFVCMLELAKTEEDFELLCELYCDPDAMLSKRAHLRRIFEKADLALGKG